jgi:hypothetical protein
MYKFASDKRKQRRIGWKRPGRILLLAGGASIDCMVMDISVGGARILVSIPEIVPDYFKLDYGSSAIPECGGAGGVKSEYGSSIAAVQDDRHLKIELGFAVLQSAGWIERKFPLHDSRGPAEMDAEHFKLAR